MLLLGSAETDQTGLQALSMVSLLQEDHLGILPHISVGQSKLGEVHSPRQDGVVSRASTVGLQYPQSKPQLHHLLFT